MRNTVISVILNAKDLASKVLTGALGKISGAVRSVGGVLTGAVGKVTALIGAFAGAAAIRETVTSLTELQRVSERLTMSSSDLAAGQLAAFKLAGVGADQYNDALTEVRIKIEEMSSIGSGGAIDFFEVLNADVDEFMKLNPQDQLLKIAETMEGMSDSAKFTFLDQIGSDPLRELLPALQDGGKAMKELISSSKEAGKVLTDFDNKSVTSLGKEVREVAGTVSTIFKKSFSSIAPELQAVVEMIGSSIGGLLESTNKNAGTFSSIFLSIVKGTISVVNALGKSKDYADIYFLAQKRMWARIAEVVLMGMAAIEKGVGVSLTAVANVMRSAFAGLLHLINNNFLVPISNAFNAFSPDRAISKKMSKAVADLRKYADEINANPLVFTSKNDITATLDALRETQKNATEGIRKNREAAKKDIIDSEKKMAELEEAALNIRKKNQEAIDAEAKRRDENLAKGGDAKLQIDNISAASEIAKTRAKLQSDMLKAEIQQHIETIDHKKQLDLMALTQRAAREKLTAKEIAETTAEIELKAARETADARKQILGEELKALEVQLAGQRSELAAEATAQGRATASKAIAATEAEIALKKHEQTIINANLINQNAMILAQKEAELENIREGLKLIRESGEIELMALRGDTFNADLAEIEREFRDTIKEMEAMGEDSEAIKELISVKKAKAELSQIEKEFEDLKRRLERNEIGGLEFLEKAASLADRAQGQASITGDSDDLERVRKLGEEADAQVFNIQGRIDEISRSAGAGIGQIFTDLVTGTKDAKTAFSEFAQSMLKDITQIIAKLLMQLALQQMISSFSGGGAFSQGAASILGKMSAGLNHTGGLVGTTGIAKQVNPLIFAGAQRYHTGGIMGLKPNEVPIIAEKGEEMLTESDPRHRKNMGKSQKQEAPKVTVVNMLDNNAIAKAALESPEGEKMVLNIINNNRGQLQL